jgi:PilZ domain
MLQGLISKLSWLGLPLSGVAESASASGEEIDAVIGFEQLVGELHLAAMQVAVVTSGINALGDGVRLKNPLALQDLGPQMPNADKITLPRHCREELGVAFKSIAAVRDFFAELESAQADVEQFCADADEFGTEEAAFLDLPAVADRWRCLSLRALTAVVALEKDVARCLPGRYSNNTPLLKKLLRKVIEGGRPCVDENATVKLPDLPQRRAAVRPNVHLPCVLEYHGRTFKAAAKDISTGGVGLEEAPALEPQTVVLIEFEHGHCIAGLVVWSKGTRAGVKFDAPLKPNHPLLAPRTA